MAGEAMDLCLRVLKESNRSSFDSCSVRNSVLVITHITFRDCHLTAFPTAFLEIAVHNALIQSQFDYCNIAWGNWGKTLFDRLQKLQNRAARVVTFSRYDADANRLFRQLEHSV